MGPFPHDAPPAAITAQNPMGTDGFAFVEFARDPGRSRRAKHATSSGTPMGRRPLTFLLAPRGEHSRAGQSKAGDLSQSASPQRRIALIHFRIRLRVRNTDHKTMVEKNTNDGSAIGGRCRGELRVIRLGHCHAAWPTVEGPQFRKSAGGDRSH